MIIEKITVQKVFPIGPYTNVKIGIEASLDKEEDVKVAITDAEEILNDWFNNSYPNVGQPITYAQVESKEDSFSGPIPQKKIARNLENSVKTTPDKETRVKYAKAVASNDSATIANLESIYNFTIG